MVTLALPIFLRRLSAARGSGNRVLVARIVDVFTDPLMGFISDRVPTRWGRRKPWVVLSVPVMMTAIYMLFMPPDGAGGTHMLIWMLVLGLGQTMVIIPYWSWGAELRGLSVQK